VFCSFSDCWRKSGAIRTIFLRERGKKQSGVDSKSIYARGKKEIISYFVPLRKGKLVLCKPLRGKGKRREGGVELSEGMGGGKKKKGIGTMTLEVWFPGKIPERGGSRKVRLRKKKEERRMTLLLDRRGKNSAFWLKRER